MATRKTLFPTLGLMFASILMALPALAADEPIATSSKVKALPAVVQKTVRAEGVGATIRDVLTETDSLGVTTYEVEMRIKGLNKDIVVGLDGTLLISEQQMTLASLPPAVRSALVKSAGKRKIVLIESVTKDGKLEYYEAEVATGKTVTDIKVAPDGAIVP